MGYTHYFPQQRAFTDDEWNKLCEAARRYIDVAKNDLGIIVQRDYDDDAEPEINDDHIWFNGVGDDAHETFYITKEKMDDFNWCKTELKPYDLVVGLILLSAHKIAPNALKITSDGQWDEWIRIREAYESITGIAIDCPWTVTESDGPLVTISGLEYDVWNDNTIQYPRLIAELQMAGAFTEQVIADLCDSMDLEQTEVQELIDRACDEFDQIKSNT